MFACRLISLYIVVLGQYCKPKRIYYDNKKIMNSGLKRFLLQVVNKYVFVLDQLVNMVNVDIVISYDVFHRNISQQYIQLFDHFPIEEEI